MSQKFLARLTALTILALLAALLPLNVQAGGVCGGTWVAEAGDTVEKLAATCGTTTSAIYAANPGIGNVLKAGQTLTIPGPSSSSVTPGTVTSTPTGGTTTYVVRYGDTFAKIAQRYGISMYNLWGLNQQIADINKISVGQVINVPASAHPVTPVPAADAKPLTWGKAPKNAPYGSVAIDKKTTSDVYISLQSTTGDGTLVINEFPVRKSFTEEIPSGWVVYVAWIGGEKYSGAFKLGADGFRTITIYKNRVVVD